MIKLIFRLFLELIFSRSEEYDFKSKHFKPGKVIFTGIVVISFCLNFLFVSLGFRNGVKYVELYEERDALAIKVQELEKNMSKSPQAQPNEPKEK